MNILKLSIKELAYRKINFTLTFLPVFLSVGICVAMITLTQAAYKEINRQMRNLGTNLIIHHKDMKTFDFIRDGFTNHTLPESYIEKISKADVVTVQHLIGSIYKPYELNGLSVFVNGTMVAAQVSHSAKQSPMGTNIPRGKAFLGYAIAKELSLPKGATIKIRDMTFTIDKIFAPKENREDLMVYINLKDAQEIFNMENKVNVIRAIQCKVDCESGISIDDRLNEIKNEIKPLIPEAHVYENSQNADIREKTRNMMARFTNLIVPIILITSFLWISLVSFSNVKERRQEIGLLKAIGVSNSQLSFLFLSRAGLVGILGAVAGFFVGSLLSIYYGPQIFPDTGKSISIVWNLLLYSPLIAITIAIMAAYIPTMIAANQDPAVVLKEEA